MEPWYSPHWLSPAQWQQFHVAYPLALSLIPAVPVLFLIRYYLNRKAQQRLNISTGQLYAGAGRIQSRRSWLSLLRYLLPLSVFIGISFLLVALSRPQIVRTQRDEQSEGIDIMLAIDVSESMSETDLPPNRLAAARRVAQLFVNSRKNDRIGLVVFAGEAFSLCPLTTDYDLLKQYLSELDSQMIRTSGTAIGDALARCINRMRERVPLSTDTTQAETNLDNQKRSKLIILLSDGDNTAGNLDPVTAARLAKAFSIKLYTIAVGRPVVSSSQAVTVDEGILKTIATIGNGSFFRATDTRRLQSVFAQINRLEKSPIHVRIYEDVQDFYRVYLYWGIAFLLVALLLKNTIFGNVLED
ncbi:VWA domain-containing protein [Spirosoma sp. HMF4905]|uniref:VWA domain-containing protein n=1 Tax=Spirosoma arboris TaxID=2682092 RepID=A0A7K1S7A6_9BACT|nr:VWA domain-containing protein [Spirosoma arboris]MVM29488.1 VWA domain-containing protein [Spirosoma arboris]